MSNNNDQVRVLNRMGARDLTREEVQNISGGIVPTRLTVIPTGTPQSPDHHIDE